MISSHPVTEKAFGRQREPATERAILQEQGPIPRETPVEYGSRPMKGQDKGKQRDDGEIVSPRERVGFWERSKQRARSDRSSWDYGMSRNWSCVSVANTDTHLPIAQSLGAVWLAVSLAVL
jgi:hypothetical protein